jgi:hypothetical protein
LNERASPARQLNSRELSAVDPRCTQKDIHTAAACGYRRVLQVPGSVGVAEEIPSYGFTAFVDLENRASLTPTASALVAVRVSG